MSVTLEHDPPFFWFSIDRPTALNAVDFDVMARLEEALDRVEADASIKVFVLSGVGRRSFISGGDLRKFAQLETREDVEMMARRMRAILDRFEALEAWTIAAVNGPAYGGGCETALACDFRIAADNATFGFTQANFAVPPGWGGLTRLVEVVGKPTALKWLAQSEIVDASTALASNLVHEVVPYDELEGAVRDFSKRLVRHDRTLVGALKRGMHGGSGRRDAIEAELDPFVECWLSDGHHRRIEKFLQRSE